LSELHREIEQLRPATTQTRAATTNVASISDDQLKQRRELADTLDDLEQRRAALQDDLEGEHTQEIGRLNEEIGRVRNQLLKLAARNDSDSSDQGDLSDIPLINISHTHNYGAVDDILSSLADVNTQQVQSQIEELDQSILAAATQHQEDVAELKSLSQKVTGDSFVVRQALKAWSVPMGGVPQLGVIMVCGSISLFIGAVVASWFRPELLDRGFESHHQAMTLLGVPVIDSLKSLQTQYTLPATPLRGAFANSIVRYAEILVIAIILLLIIVMTIDSGVRAAFFANPFHGLAKIAWMFSGN
jgi:hypothetical protein